MMKIGQIIKSALFAFGLMAITANAKVIVDNEVLMDKAIAKFNEVYSNSGMAGLETEVDRCYKNNKLNKLYCFYLDYSARIIDDEIATQMNFPKSDYFDDEEFGDRVMKYIYQSTDMDEDEINTHLMHVYFSLKDKLITPKRAK